MKKIIILVLTFLLTACSHVPKTPLTAVNKLDVVKETLYEIDNKFNVESDLINIFHIDQQYAYISIWNIEKSQYEFYKYSQENNLELIYIYEYDYDPLTDNSNSNTSCVIYKNQLIFTDRDEDNEYTKIFKVEDGKLETIYEVNAIIFELEIRNNCLFFGESKTVEIKEDVMANHTICKFISLETYEEEENIPIYTEFNLNTGKISETSDSNITFDSDDGYVFIKDNHLYFHDYTENKDCQLFELNNTMNKYNYYSGNEQCIVTYYDNAIHYIIKEDNQYKDYYINKDRINFEFDYFYGGYIDDQYYCTVFNAKNQFFMFDYVNKELSIYKNNEWHKEGYLHIIDGNVYCVEKKDNKIIIENCTFSKV